MRNINILHLSDLHIKNNTSPNSIIKIILQDIGKISKTNKIDFICFTGDIINSGSNNGELYQKAREIFIDPLLKAADINENKFFICQGNHENDLNLFDDIIYEGITSKINNENKLYQLWDSHRIYQYVSQDTNNFQDFLRSINSTNIISKLSSYSIINIDKYSIGIVILNSSWMCCGDSTKDYGKLILGYPELRNAYEKIIDTDFKIVMFHHPFEYICEIDRINCAKILNEFDLILTGHIHDINQYQKFSEINNNLFLTAGQLNDTSGTRNGYSLIEINPFNKNVTITFRKYYYKRHCFDISTEESKNGTITYKLNTQNTILKEAYNLSMDILLFYEQSLKDRLITNLFYNNKNCSYIEPYIKNNSEFTEFTEEKEDKVFTIDDILLSNKKYLLFGKQNYGKSTTLKIISFQCCKDFNKYQKYPIIIDFDNFDFNGHNQLLRGIKKLIKQHHNKIINEEVLEELINQGYLLVMIDNADITKNKQIDAIDSFLKNIQHLN